MLVIDGQNFMHRAKAGFQFGAYSIVFNFFRNLRALIDQHKPTKVFFVLEGKPVARLEQFPEYKSQRKLDEYSLDPVVLEKIVARNDFFRQVDLILDLMKKTFPISIVKHPNFECDDTIYNLIKHSSISSSAEWIVVSNDSDFIQLLNEFENVKLYNPMKKEFVSKPDYCYVAWKSLRGDGSDNIKGLPKIGDKTAIELLSDPDKLCKLFINDELAKQFSDNYKLIKFHDWTFEEQKLMITTENITRKWHIVETQFTNWEFKSLLKEPTWTKFVDTFDTLF